MSNYDEGYRDGYDDALTEYRESVKNDMYEIYEKNKDLYTLNEQKLIYEVLDNVDNILEYILEKKKG